MNSKVQESISTKQKSFKFWKHDPREANKQELKLQQALSKRKLQRAKVGFQEQTSKDFKINNKIFLRYIRTKRPTTEFVQAKGVAKEDNYTVWKLNDFPFSASNFPVQCIQEVSVLYTLLLAITISFWVVRYQEVPTVKNTEYIRAKRYI